MKPRTYLLVALAFAAVVALTVLANPPVAHTDSGFPVTVINTPNVHVNNGSLPVTQSGSWNVGVNNSSLPVTQSGAWNVGLNGTPSVLVGNTTPIPVATVPNLLYEVGIATLTLSSPAVSGTANVSVTAGDTFVVNFVSATCSLPTTEKVQMLVEVYDESGNTWTFFLLPAFIGTFTGNDVYTSDQGITFTSDSKWTMQFGVIRSSGTGSADCTAFFSGYLLPIS
jgi:hypothetical protein